MKNLWTVRERPLEPPERPLEPPERLRRCCPVCGVEEPERIVEAPGEAVLGCDMCLRIRPAWEWFEEQAEGGGDD